MKANARGVIEGSKFGLGKALVVAQVALSLLLVVGAGLMLSTFFKLETVDATLNAITSSSPASTSAAAVLHRTGKASCSRKCSAACALCLAFNLPAFPPLRRSAAGVVEPEFADRRVHFQIARRYADVYLNRVSESVLRDAGNRLARRPRFQRSRHRSIAPGRDRESGVRQEILRRSKSHRQALSDSEWR